MNAVRTPKWGPWSFSKINAYQQCHRKFYYWYVLKVPMKWVDTIATQRGSLIHLIFELERDTKKIKNHRDFKEIIQKKILSSEDIKGCFKIYDSFVKSKKGQSLMQKERLFAELPLGLDHDLNFTKYDDNPFLRGYIDDARVVPNNEKSIVLIDWKSGRSKTHENQDWTQLMYYGIGMFGMNPHLEKVVMCFAYVEHDHLNLKVIKREELQKYKQALWDVTDKIEADVLFEKNETALCDYCFFQEHCTADTDVTLGLTEDDLPF